MLDGPTLSDERVRALAEELLARPRYAGYRGPKSALQQLIDRVADWLRGVRLPDWLGDLWESVGNALLGLLQGVFGDEPLALLVRFVLAGAVLAAAVWMIASAARALREGPRASGAAAGPQPPPTRAWLEQADSLADQGRFLEAAHCTQLAALQLLLRAEWLSLDRSEPNRTLRRRLREAPLPEALRADFLGLLDRLESRWFRDRAEDRELYGAWRGLHARLEAVEPRP